MQATTEVTTEVTTETEFPAESPPSTSAGNGLSRIVLAVAVLGVIVFMIVWSAGAERRALRNLAPAERQGLYLRTLQNLEQVCAASGPSMRDFCEDQARLLEAFPQCDDSCYRIAEKQLSRVQSPR
jgi:hypothetical protein